MERRCYICSSKFEVTDEDKFTMDEHLYSVLTLFSASEDMEIRSKRNYICGGCSSALFFYIEQKMKPIIRRE